MAYKLTSSQEEALVALRDRHSAVLSLQTGLGKCFALDTDILMHSGTIKRVQDILVGDTVMGWDGQPRAVVGTTQGVDELYSVYQSAGCTYTVNSAHILVLKVSGRGARGVIDSYGVRYYDGDLIKITVEDYIKTNISFKRFSYGFKSYIDYEKKDTVISPYVCGLFYGVQLKSGRTEDQRRSYYKSLAGTENTSYEECLQAFLTEGEIPAVYLTTDRESRQALYLGLCLAANNKKPQNIVRIQTVSVRLRDSITRLINGLQGKIRHYKREHPFSGTVQHEMIITPIEVRSKQAKDLSISTTKVLPVGPGTYYGFTLAGVDQMFVLPDLTVVHNSLLTLHYAKELMSKGYGTIFFIPKSAHAAYEGELVDKLEETEYTFITSGKEVEDFPLGLTFVEFPVLTKYLDKLVHAVRTKETYMFVDEAHVLCSKNSMQSECLRRIRKDCAGCYSITATPFLTDMEDLFHLYKSTFPSLALFKNWNKFRDRYCITQEKKLRMPSFRGQRIIFEIIGYKNTDELYPILDQLTIKGSVQYNVEYIAKATQLDEQLEDTYSKAAQGILEEDRVKEWGARLHDLQRIVDGVDTHETNNKTALLLESVEEISRRGEGCLVYVEYLETVPLLEGILRAEQERLGIKNIYTLSGKENEQRKIEVEQKIGPFDVVIITKACAQSRNLQRVNNLIMYNIPFSVGSFLQLTGRICRVSTTYEKQYFYLLEVERTIDTYKLELSRSHIGAIDKLLGGDCKGTVNFQYIVDDKMDLKKIRSKLLWRR